MAKRKEKKSEDSRAEVVACSEESCSGCLFWRKLNENQGACRRFPPSTYPLSSWPLTKVSDWCGEFVRLP